MKLPAEGNESTEIPAAARAFYDKAQESLARGDVGGAKMHLMIAKSKGDSPLFEKLSRKIADSQKAKK